MCAWHFFFFYEAKGKVESALPGHGAATHRYRISGKAGSALPGLGAGRHRYSISGKAGSALPGLGAGRHRYSISGKAESALPGHGAATHRYPISGKAGSALPGHGAATHRYSILGKAECMSLYLMTRGMHAQHYRAMAQEYTGTVYGDNAEACMALYFVNGTENRLCTRHYTCVGFPSIYRKG